MERNAKRSHSSCAGTGVAYEGKVYQFGGADGPAYANATNTAGYYDLLSDTANEVTQMPAKRMLQGSAVLNHNIYVLGGVDESSVVYPSVWCYDPAGDSWSISSSMPEALMALQAVSLNGTLYAIGGGVSSCTDAVYAYDPNSGTWTQKASMNEARMYHGAVTHNGKIYVFGGQNGSGTLSSCEVYDPQSNNWSYLPAMHGPLYAFGITSDGEEIFIIGGNYSAGILRFDPATEDWSFNTNSLLDLPKGISYASAAFLPHYGHILFGGRDTANLFNEIYCLDLYAPDHVSGLSANPGDGEVSLSWTNPNVDFSGCKVSVSPGSQTIDVGNASQYTVTGLTNDQEYTFELITYDDMDNESGPLTESATPQASDSGDDGDSGDVAGSSSGGGGGCFVKILQD